MSPTQRTLAYLRSLGYICAITEHYNYFAKIRQDLFGFCDILALKGKDTICVQTTSGGNTAERVAKIKPHKNYPILKEAGWKILVIGWRKLKGKWTEKVIEL